jgi:hypothetical protein
MSVGQILYPSPRGIPSVGVDSPLSGFGELQTVAPQPTGQVAFIYGLNPLLVTSDVYGAGASVSAVNGEATLASGTATDGYARLTSKKVAKYRAGQATLARWTARFTTGSSGNRQMAGLYNIEAGYQIGYNGTQFGILYTETGTVEVQTLTITTKASSATNVTVTLDGGTPVTVAVTNGANTSVTAAEIAAGNYSQSAGGWDAVAVGNVVYFTRKTAGPAGASTFNPGTSGALGTFAILTTGVNPTETFIAQSTWNGTVPTGFDPTKGNVYGVQFQYLGYGDAFFYIEDGGTGRFVLVHTIRNANTRTSTNLRNPNLYLTWESKNTGTGTSVTMRGASGGTFVEGQIAFLGAQFATTVTKTIGAATETPVLSLRADTVYQNRLSTAQLQIDRLSVACDGTKSVDFKVYKNGTLTAPQFARVNANTSAADYDSAATALTLGNGTQVYAFSVAKTGNETESVTDLDLFLQTGDTLTITAYSVNASDVSASIIWVEDV